MEKVLNSYLQCRLRTVHKYLLEVSTLLVFGCLPAAAEVNGVVEEDLSAVNLKVEGDSSRIVAKHNGQTITTHDVSAIISTMRPLHQEFIKNNKGKLLKIVLNVLERKVMVEEAYKLGLDKNLKTSWELESAQSEVLVNALVENYRQNVKAPDADLNSLAKEWYVAHPEKYMKKTRVNISHILFRSVKADSDQRRKQQLKKAEMVLKELQQGLDFSVAAKKYSEDRPTAVLGGSLGLFEKGKMVPVFDTAAFSLKQVGDLSEIIETPYGFHILKLIDRELPDGVRPFEEVEQSIIEKVKAKYIAGQVDKFIESFAISKKTTVFTDVFDLFHSDYKKKVLSRH